MDAQSQRNMTGVLKEFDRTSHGKNDTLGKDALITYLKRTIPEYTHIENPDEYGIDVLSINKSGEVIACWEVERREKNWVGDVTFPFRDINCLERKDHQWNKAPTFTKHINYPLHTDYSVYYVQMNDLCTRIAVIDGDVVLKYPLKEWRNRFVANGEYVRQVPITEVHQYKIS
jgi:hypothetical protein